MSEALPITRLRSLDVLRGAAALGVTLYHVRVYLWTGSRAILGNAGAYGWGSKLLALVMSPCFFLDSGVILFFVISGFCVHWPVAVAGNRGGGVQQFAEGATVRAKISWRVYGVRRFLRLYPPYLAALLITLIFEGLATWVVGSDRSAMSLFRNSVFMMQNYLPPGGQMAGNSALWSVPVEAELYLAYPVLFFLTRRLGWPVALVLVTAISIGASVSAFRWDNWINGNFLKFWAIWAAGAGLAERVARGRMQPFRLGWGVIMVSAGLLAVTLAATGAGYGQTHLVYGLAFVLLLQWLAGRETAGAIKYESVLSAALRRAGEWSYSLYLIHFPLFYCLGKFWEVHYGQKPAGPWLAMAGGGSAIMGAMLFYRWVEQPFHRLARTMGKVVA